MGDHLLASDIYHYRVYSFSNPPLYFNDRFYHDKDYSCYLQFVVYIGATFGGFECLFPNPWGRSPCILHTLNEFC